MRYAAISKWSSFSLSFYLAINESTVCYVLSVLTILSVFLHEDSLDSSGVARNLRQVLLPPFPPLLPFVSPIFPSLPLPLLRSRPLKYTASVSSSSGVWGGAPAEIEFGVILALKADIWWH